MDTRHTQRQKPGRTLARLRLRSRARAPPRRDPCPARPPRQRTRGAGVPTLPISFPRLYTRPELGSRRKTETSGRQLCRRRRRRGSGSIPPGSLAGGRTSAASAGTTARGAALGAARCLDASYWPRGEGWSPDARGGQRGRGRARGGAWACGDAGLAGVPGSRAALAPCTPAQRQSRARSARLLLQSCASRQAVNCQHAHFSEQETEVRGIVSFSRGLEGKGGWEGGLGRALPRVRLRSESSRPEYV